MNTAEYIKVRQSAIDEYDRELRCSIKIDNDSVISRCVIAAGLEAFGRGFDAAAVRFESTPKPPEPTP